jgi:hypothetical protein
VTKLNNNNNNRRHRLDALFLIQVYFGLKFCPSVLEIVGLRVPARYITLHCSMVDAHVKIVPLLYVQQLLMLFAGMLTYSEPGKIFSIVSLICYNYYYYFLGCWVIRQRIKNCRHFWPIVPSHWIIINLLLFYHYYIDCLISYFVC